MLRSVSLASALSRPQSRALSHTVRARMGLAPARGLDSTLLALGSTASALEGHLRHGTLHSLLTRAFSSHTGQALLSDPSFRRTVSQAGSSKVLDNLRRVTGVNLSRADVRQFSEAAMEFANNPKGFGQFGKKESKVKEEPEEDAPKKKASDESSDKKEKQKGVDFNAFFGKDKKKSDDDDDDSSSNNNKDNTPNTTGLWIMVFVALLVLSVLANQPPGDRGSEMTFQQFRQELLARGNVKSITVVDGKTARVFTNLDSTQDPHSTRYFFHIGSVESFERAMDQAQRDLGMQPLDFVPIRYSKDDRVAVNKTAATVINVALLAIPIILIYRFSRNVGKMMGRGPFGGGGGGGGGPFGFGRAKPVIANKETKVSTTFADVAGLDEAKLEVMEFVKFLKSPGKFTKLGAKLPKGALLVGPPGTGKTLLARATAGESGVPFFSMSGSDFQEMYVGVGPARVRDLFKQARASAPCIVFIDEIDAVGRKRGKGNFGGNEERENTLNQLLVEMDGFKSDTGVVVLGGTNRSDILDPALLRPGRFDRQILVDKPDIRGRRQIFEVHLKKLKLADPISELAQRLSALTPGFAGADIANICNEAAIIAARHNKEAVELVDFEAATDRVIGGLEKKNKVMTQEERRIVAYHEAGHAVAGWFFEHADPLLKVTIVPRGAAALGYAQYLPQELNLYRENQIIDKICMALGGRVAEQIFFSHISTGAADDLKKVTSMAYNFVSVFGMSERLPHLSYQTDGQEFQKPYSEKTAEIIDEEVGKLVKTAYNRTVELLNSKKTLIDALATRLLKDETINHDVIVSVLGPRPFETQTYTDFVRDAGRIDWTTGKPHEGKADKGADSDGGSGGSGGSKARTEDDSNKPGPEGAPAPVAPSSSQ